MPPISKGIHGLSLPRRDLCEEGTEDLDQITEFFKGHPHAVNSRRIAGLDGTAALDDPPKRCIDRAEYRRSLLPSQNR